MYLVREDDMYMTSIRVLTFCWPRISVINQLDAQNVCFTISLFHASTCLVHETATYRCDDTTGCLIQFWPPDDEHMWSKYVEAWKEKLTVKQKFCASSCLITEINNQLGCVGKSMLSVGAISIVQKSRACRCLVFFLILSQYYNYVLYWIANLSVLTFSHHEHHLLSKLLHTKQSLLIFMFMWPCITDTIIQTAN